ncbi:fatty acyl-AMP ligase [Nocardia amamiensis]|uniref:fatty acyl-AMP ligase n=1 Tax=Nocardia amamiensis TaxID=404578 RepID=UPI000B01BE00|nr:fatty acyl-AMP ligase [Nocardia amamiensis]
MTRIDHAPGNILAAQVAHWAATRPDEPAYTELRFRLQERVPVTVTYAGLHAAAGALAARLRRESAPGDRVAILCAHGIDYAVAFLACLYSNRIAVPLFPAGGTRNRDRVHAILADARPTMTLLSAHDEITAVTLGPALGRVLTVPPEPSGPIGDSREPAANPLVLATRPAMHADAFPAISAAASASPGRPRRAGQPTDSVAGSTPPLGSMRAAPRIPAAAQTHVPVVDPVCGELAYLQYTSGSTKSPAGVRVTHENLAAALAQLRDAVFTARDRPIVTWLPFFHDMGLILGLALPLWLGVHGVTLAPSEFVKRPIRWLRAIADYRAGITGCPNFALTLAVSGTTPQERTGLDLSGLDVLLNGSEPVRADALKEFTKTFAPYGFRHHAHTPGFGLAEATLTVTVCDSREEPVWHHFERAALAEGRAVALPDNARQSQHGTPLVGCGTPAGQAVCVVDPVTGSALPPGRVGEIWVAGNNVCDGYFGRPDASEETFGATLPHDDVRWLRTGDLGFQYECQLYIAGRRKDVIVVDGRNHYPTDIETTVEACSPDIRPGHVTAFGHDDGRREDLVVVAELVTIGAAEPAELSALARRIRSAVASTHEVMPAAVMLVEPGRIPKTSSGKLRRGECRARYVAGHLRPLAMI